MAIVKEIFKCVLLLACIAFVLSLVKLAHDTDATVKAVPGEIAATRAVLTAEIQSTRRALLSTVNTQATTIRKTVDHRLDSIQRTANLRLDSIQQMVDARTAQAVQIADSRLSEATAQVATVQADLHPVVANAAAVTKDAQDSWHDLYRDVKASVESATVAARGIEETPEAVGKATPGHNCLRTEHCEFRCRDCTRWKREADTVTKPKHWYEKILGPVYTIGRLVVPYL